MIPARFQPTPEGLREHGERLDRLAPYLLRSDPLADEVAGLLRSPFGDPAANSAGAGGEPSWPPPGVSGIQLLEQALREGRGTLPGAPPSVEALLEHTRRVPLWVDWEAIARGGSAFMRAGMLGGIVLGAGALVLSYTSPGGNKPLVFSGRLQEQASRRLGETGHFVRAVTQPEALRQGGEGQLLSLKVRLMHAGVRRLIRQSGRFRVDLWGEPINQHDMLGTLILFSVVVIEGLAKFGYRMPPRDAEGLVHLWRYVGYLMGVDHDLLPGSYAEARRYGEMIQATQGQPDDDSRALVRALLHGDIEEARTPKQREFAEKRLRVASGIMRFLHGDELADVLAIPHSPVGVVMPVVRALVSATERARGLSPVRSWAFAAGTRYWDAAVAAGLRGIAADFMPPERLAKTEAVA
ncbi:oxygenase MpaB family protein [Chondromyces apiculatus]|uniref:ER-bound oxygenase mpaB/mpaB'/Rubber oxygenase catalytic domain-containing protein n=1 Tax=Chondromyces apiculatus DSM 436 TaxID=1192034 RepID=A0A017T642_9BACT|nr:oxygenase MpaB family protein [Chondromyces apiculatus]EYF04679.1 Hypothetical protein CAP_4355 [Chondromyces apiculatus DSM 436]